MRQRRSWLLLWTATIWTTAVALPLAALADAKAPDAKVPEVKLMAQKEDDPVFAAFNDWAKQYSTTAMAGRAGLETNGVALATQRRKALASLIVSDPKHALELAVPLPTRQTLPAAVVAQLETRVAGCGEFGVLVADAYDAKTGAMRSETRRLATIGGTAYKANVYGRRLGLTTKYNVPMHGIAIDSQMAVHESPARLLEPGETLAPTARIGNPDQRCPLCGADATKDATTGVVAQIGTTIYYFDQLAHLQKLEARMEAQEAVIGPDEGSTCDAPLAKLLNDLKLDNAQEGGAKPQ